MPNKRKANARKREKVKIEKRKRDLYKQILRLTDLGIKDMFSKKTKLAMQLKLTRLIEQYKNEFGVNNEK
tara:strand:+ start:238 stop:447 length:210 start_codon:yes stop_codon:yes gene_type:complete